MLPSVSRPAASDHGQIPALTGVRAVAAYLVFFHHHPTKLLQAGPLLLWWELHVGVTLFFVLSGFVITWRYDRRGRVRESFLKGYFLNRFARIYPLYFALVVPVMLSYHVRSPRAWLLNLTVFTSLGAGIPQAWSLRVEECFYLAAPLLFLCGSGARFFRSRPAPRRWRRSTRSRRSRRSTGSSVLPRISCCTASSGASSSSTWGSGSPSGSREPGLRQRRLADSPFGRPQGWRASPASSSVSPQSRRRPERPTPTVSTIPPGSS